MAGTIILTGANSSLGTPAVEHLIQNYGDYTAILTVRDASDADVNTNRLRQVISQYPRAKAYIYALDLSSLSATHAFTREIASEITNGRYPRLSAIICNAYYWNLVGDPELTADGFDKTMQVNHISHASLVLQLLGSFGIDGRIILLSSDSRWPGKNPMEKYPPSIPDDLSLLVRPDVDDDKQGRGYQRYATSKLAIVTWMYALNRYLQKDPNLNKVTTVAINPGNMVDSRALRSNTPISMHRMQTWVYKPLLPLLQLMTPTLRSAAPAGVDVIELAISPTYAGQQGFFTLLQKDESSPESNNEVKQESLWKQTLQWAQVTQENTALRTTFK
ncbi:NAD(P)-binding protein [Hypoxylon trugodes]|uniref:NAD(P)-binding protein n=1 Tax=Hypoxylon trugodes TaxID=326681 RepID=UPI00219E35C7|nr:NAD(P)-binding protein [Hypoxylon trugodes]KAI1391009.1 NAD(P)-binding protein [Hypoxylon trugodes]